MPIKLLDDNLINKIAAGEVIEKPASVVKELVENAIDAGATRIMVNVSQGGIDMIEVEDNGCGLSGDEVSLALQRHATSKISTAEDLFNICTMGFRGEALPSIASVARVDIYSKKSGYDGVHVTVAGGQILEMDPFACPDGTRVVITDLFYNTPARRKFLKSPVSEGRHIHEFMVKLALSRPDISFTYKSEKKTYFKTPGKGNLLDTVIAVYGHDFVSSLTPVEFTGERYSLSGLVSTPAISRVNRRNQIFFINRRPIRSPMLYKAVDEAYRGLLISREFPVVVLFITVTPEDVDVNVHPQKTEVRFRDEKTVFKMVCGIVRKALEEIDYRFTGEIKPGQPPFIAGISSRSNISTAPALYEKSLRGFETVFPGSSNEKQAGWIPSAVKSEYIEINEPAPGEYRVIGQCLKSYIMVENKNELWLVDQHAAHERINYARLKDCQSSSRPMQMLAIPLTMQISAAKMQLLEKNRQLIVNRGLDIDTIGPTTIVLRAAPIMIQGKEFEIINELLDLLEDDKVIDLEHETIAMMACKKAIKAGECLTMAEMEKIIKDLLSVDNFRNCPHGRPTMLCLSRQEIDRRFKRL